MSYQPFAQKYKVTKTLIINEKLFVEGDEIYVQYYDPEGGRDQLVFDSDKQSIGKITSKLYWSIEKSLEEIQTKNP